MTLAVTGGAGGGCFSTSPSCTTAGGGGARFNITFFADGITALGVVLGRGGVPQTGGGATGVFRAASGSTTGAFVPGGLLAVAGGGGGSSGAGGQSTACGGNAGPPDGNASAGCNFWTGMNMGGRGATQFAGGAPGVTNVTGCWRQGIAGNASGGGSGGIFLASSLQQPRTPGFVPGGITSVANNLKSGGGGGGGWFGGGGGACGDGVNFWGSGGGGGSSWVNASAGVVYLGNTAYVGKVVAGLGGNGSVVLLACVQSPSATATATATVSRGASASNTALSTVSPTSTATASSTPSASATAASTISSTPSFGSSPSTSATATSAATATSSGTTSATSSDTPLSASASVSATDSSSSSFGSSPSQTATASVQSSVGASSSASSSLSANSPGASPPVSPSASLSLTNGTGVNAGAGNVGGDSGAAVGGAVAAVAVVAAAAAAFFILSRRRRRGRLAAAALSPPISPSPSASVEARNPLSSAQVSAASSSTPFGGQKGAEGRMASGASFRAPPLLGGDATSEQSGTASSTVSRAQAPVQSAATFPSSARLSATLGAGGLGASPQLASALQRASARNISSSVAREPAPVLVAGVILHAQATRAGRENAEVGLPPGWSAHWSNSRNVWYWKGPGGEVSWDKPAAKSSRLSISAEDAAAAAEAAAKESLPDGWAAVWSRSREAWYWRNDSSGETTWDKPL